MDIAKLKVTSSEIGGGFGGKTHVWMEPVALALSRKANRPVKLVMTRDEVFRATGPTCSTSIDVKIGATRDGRITAAKAVLRYQDGAFPCDLGHARRDDVVGVLRPRQREIDRLRRAGEPAESGGLSRTVGADGGVRGGEHRSICVAAEIGMDPVDFRIKNAAKEGTRASYGPDLRTDRHRPDARRRRKTTRT